jgi:hypothetical protein
LDLVSFSLTGTEKAEGMVVKEELHTAKVGEQEISAELGCGGRGFVKISDFYRQWTAACHYTITRSSWDRVTTDITNFCYMRQ